MKKYMVMVCGKSGTGKTMSLKNLRNPESVWYFNCEGDPDLPFDDQFGKKFLITDPRLVVEGVERAETKPEVHTIVIDSVTFLLDMYVNQIVYTAANKQAEWGEYARWFENFMTITCAKSTKNLIFLAHTVDVFKDNQLHETHVVLPGQKLNIKGFESFFNTIVGTKKMNLFDLQDYANDHLTISEREKRKEFKHVLQTDVTSETKHERIRGKDEMWSWEETFIDNNLQIVIDRMRMSEKTPLQVVQ